MRIIIINLLTNVDLNVRTTTKDLLDFIKTGMKYYKCEKPELTDESLMSKLEKQWEDYKSDAESWAIYHKQERKRAAARARYDSEKAKNKYETVTKPRMQAKKQEVIEQKLALLHEYKEKYGVECKFIYVHSPYDAEMELEHSSCCICKIPKAFK